MNLSKKKEKNFYSILNLKSWSSIFQCMHFFAFWKFFICNQLKIYEFFPLHWDTETFLHYVQIHAKIESEEHFQIFYF